MSDVLTDSKKIVKTSNGESMAKLVGPPVLVFLAFIGFWYAVSASMVERRRNILLPFPHDVVDVAIFNAEPFKANENNLVELLNGVWLSFQVALAGLLISMIIGVFAAIVMSQAKWAERSFYPYAILLQTIPILALVPMIGSWLGFGFRARLLVAVLISLFPIITNTLFGIKSTSKELHDMLTLHDASRFTRLVKLQLPASLPSMFTGFQISAGLAVIGTVVGEFFFGKGDPGIGLLIQLYAARVEPEMLIAAIFLSCFLGIFFFVVVGWLANRITGEWSETANGSK